MRGVVHLRIIKELTPAMSINLKLLYMVLRNTADTREYAFIVWESGIRRISYPPSLPTTVIIATVDVICARRRTEAFGNTVMAILFKTSKADEDRKYRDTRTGKPYFITDDCLPLREAGSCINACFEVR
jgi:hypothetical protein